MRAFYSGHADLNGLCEFALSVGDKDKVKQSPKPVRVFLNHGNIKSLKRLKKEIESRAGKDGYRDVASVEFADGLSQWFDLDKGEIQPPAEGIESKLDRILKRQDEIRAMLAAIMEKLGPVTICCELPSASVSVGVGTDCRDGSLRLEPLTVTSGAEEVTAHTVSSESGNVVPETHQLKLFADPISDDDRAYIDVKRST